MVLKLTPDQKEMVKIYNKSIADGSIAIENTTCLCHSKDSTKIAENDRYGFWHPVLACKKCGLVMHNPHLTYGAYKHFYSSDEYRKLYDEAGFVGRSEDRYKNKEGRHIKETLLPFLRDRAISRILEVGCAGGWNLLHFAKDGHKVVGYDFGPALIEHGKTKGLDLRVGTIKDVEGKYDLIILNHVAEHFTDFIGEMRALITHLNPGGIVYVAVPNIDNYSWDQLQNAHVFYFSPRTFKHYMQRCGFKLIEFGPAQQIHMYGIFEYSSDPIKLDLLKSEHDLVLMKIRRGKIKDNIFSLFAKLGVEKKKMINILSRIKKAVP